MGNSTSSTGGKNRSRRKCNSLPNSPEAKRYNQKLEVHFFDSFVIQWIFPDSLCKGRKYHVIIIREERDTAVLLFFFSLDR